MRVRYFIEYALRLEADGRHAYQPIGVWARGEGPWELTILYVPEAEERQWAADIAVCDYMERGDDHFPDDLLEGWIGAVSLYDGDCSQIYPTEARNSETVALRVLEIIRARAALPDPPVP